jgi:hypothetical protein
VPTISSTESERAIGAAGAAVVVGSAGRAIVSESGSDILGADATDEVGAVVATASFFAIGALLELICGSWSTAV